MALELAVIVVLCLANGLFSATELAMVSARQSRLEQRADEGDRGARAALELQDDPNRLLSTVQIGITLIGTLAGAFGGANIAESLGALLEPYLGGYSENVALGIIVALIAYLSLVLGELVPKRLALQSAEGIAIRMARPMLVISQITRPVVALLTWSTVGLLALLGRRDTAASSVTEEDIRHLVREGATEGALEPQETEMIESVISLGDRTVRQIMTPRHRVEALAADAKLADIMDHVLEVGFSRFPVYGDDPDTLVGIVHVRDLARHARAGDTLVRDAMRPPVLVPENSRAAALLPIFRRTQQHMALVVSELGSIEGLVTLEDVLEEIVGEIDDEHDERNAALITRRDDGSLLLDGMTPIDVAQRALEIEDLPDSAIYRFDTLAGLILTLVGHIPQAGETASLGEWRFEVVDMDGLRIDKVLATRASGAARDDEPDQ